MKKLLTAVIMAAAMASFAEEYVSPGRAAGIGWQKTAIERGWSSAI